MRIRPPSDRKTAAASLLIICASVLLTTTARAEYHVLPFLELEVATHFDLGVEMGRRFTTQIASRYDQSTELPTLMDFVRGEGKSVYDAFLRNATAKWPQYVAELEGVAHGSGQPFDRIFTQNMREEIGYFVPSLAGHTWIGHCSDVIVVSPDSGQFLDAHNEDSSSNDRNNTFLLHATVGAEAPFHAYVYAGDLPSGAFGWTSNSLAFSLNYVRPAEGVLGGYGRGFLSRNLLDAATLDEMLAIATLDGQCAGHNYQLMDFDAKRALNVEAANYGQAAVYEVVAAPAATAAAAAAATPDSTPDSTPYTSPLFHANEYLHLELNQTYSASSQARELRFSELPAPVDAASALVVLGDDTPTHPPPPTQEQQRQRQRQEQRQQQEQQEADDDDVYTIYGVGLHGGYTLHSALFDLEARKITVMADNPAQGGVELYHFQI